ncbi:MAG: c-type cytochrome [Planctomycetes bacterium]|nr:c-type cytochrome [Planctomycetota bacterium]
MNRTARRMLAAAALLTLAARALTAAPGEEWSTDANDVVAIPATRPPDTPENREAGRRIYAVRCAFCHGEKGDGNGPVAPYLNPRPRDFTSGKFKLRTTDSQTLPTDEDLYRTITRGIPGSAMPAWPEPFVSNDDRWRVAYYVKSFHRDFDDPDLKADVKPMPFGPEPPVTQALLAKGKEVYERSKCWECHGQGGRGNGANALTLLDDWHNPIRPADLTRPMDFKGGSSPRSIYQRFTTGMTGTPMPSYAGLLADEERWALAHHVAGLRREYEEGRSPSEDVLTARWFEGPLPEDPNDPAWSACERLDVRLAGQLLVAPRHWNPSIDLVSVRAAWNDAKLAFLVSWHDPSHDVRDAPPDLCPDAVALQFPAAPPTGLERPHFGNGDPRLAVTLWHWLAAAGDVQEEVGHGLLRIEPSTLEKPAGERVRARAAYSDGEWRVTFVRPPATSAPEREVQFRPDEILPFALNLWDGAGKERGAAKAISSWRFVALHRPASGSAAWIAAAVGLATAGALSALYRKWRAGELRLEI